MQRDTECYACTRNLVSQRWAENLPQRQDILYDKIIEICNDKGYKLISPKSAISSYNSYIEYECPEHGNHRVKVDNLLYGKGCPDCAK